MAKVKINLPQQNMSQEEMNKYLFELVEELRYILSNINEDNITDDFKRKVLK